MEDIAIAIVEQAAIDYRWARRVLEDGGLVQDVALMESGRKEGRKNTSNPKRLRYAEREYKKRKLLDAKNMLEDTRQFFESKWFYLLTGIEDDRLFRAIEKECDEGKYRRSNRRR